MTEETTYKIKDYVADLQKRAKFIIHKKRGS